MQEISAVKCFHNDSTETMDICVLSARFQVQLLSARVSVYCNGSHGIKAFLIKRMHMLNLSEKRIVCIIQPSSCLSL